MSDRDKKLIIFVFILAVGLLPYFFYIKDKRVEVEAIRNENKELQARYEELQRMNENREMYIEKTKEFNEKRDKIIAKYPADVLQPNYIMFLLNTEYSSLDFDLENDTYEWKYPIRFKYYTWVDNIETKISATDVEIEGVAKTTVDEVDTGYVGLTNLSKLKYSCKYEALKYILAYLKDYNDPMIYKEITMKYNEKLGQIDGDIVLAQYAISGEGREMPEVDFTPVIDDVEIIWDVDGDGTDEHPSIRGNQEVGVFGPVLYVLPEDEEEEANADADGENEEGDGENSEENSEEETPEDGETED